MVLLDGGRPPRDILPPIKHPDFEKFKFEKNEPSRFSIMPGLSISTAPLGSPNTIHSGPPPPYSCASSTTESGYGFSGYFSPPLSSTRRSTRDEKDLSSVKTLPSLPSLHEALGSDKPIQFPGPPPASQPIVPGSTPATALGQTFPDAPRGPPNPFSHPAAPPPPPPPPFTPSHPQADPSGNKTIAAMASAAPDASSQLSQSYSTSPQINHNTHRSSAGSFSSVGRPYEPVNNNPTVPFDSNHANPHLRDFSFQPQTPVQNPSSSFNFEPTDKLEETRNPFVRSNPQMPYGETVKRHLENYDVELALNEITESSSRTSDFSRIWAQRYHQSNRSSYFTESAPSLDEIDIIIRQQHRALENLSRLREFVVSEQHALSERRARAARGHFEDEYNGMHEEYKTGGFAGGDAKKRRGKAAPPGRCHSCNRAETPEWRRGPDGARTLCNACGLHYAKLTRKLGANKASAITGSNLRPKGLDPRPTHV